MLAELCRNLNGSEPRTVDRAKKTAIDSLEKQPRTILVDEADRLNIDLIEHFRDVHDLVGVPVVLIGEEHLFPTINARRRIWSRVMQTVEFGPITCEDILLFALEAASLRLDPDAAEKIGAKAGGDFRLVWAHIHALEQMARAAGTKTVDARMVEALASRQGHDAGLQNRRRQSGGRNGN
jgi:DNA transposition AAA+ family ATPase